MSTVTIAKTEYETLRRKSAAYRKFVSQKRQPARAVPAKKGDGAKKLPKWLQASLKDVEEGRVSRQFSTVEEFIRDLNS